VRSHRPIPRIRDQFVSNRPHGANAQTSLFETVPLPAFRLAATGENQSIVQVGFQCGARWTATVGDAEVNGSQKRSRVTGLQMPPAIGRPSSTMATEIKISGIPATNSQ
jgi:hypothetical protein